jgi:hypothetical protein
MWNRIDRLRRDRTRKGSSTVMNWIQSHVQDEAMRVSTSSNIECACRAASGCESECTVPGDECHWMHEGNDEADRLAKLLKDMCEITDPTELLKGEEGYVLGCRSEVAQGSYRPWVQAKVVEKYIDTSESVFSCKSFLLNRLIN